MTHGTIRVRDAEGKEIILYAWHDGHTTEAIKMLADLPFTIFDAAKQEAHNTFVKDKHSGGLWWYWHVIKL